MNAVDRAREDIAAGRLWKARDRLAGAMRNAPHNQLVIDLLGDVHLAMGDVPAAGRVLMLSARNDDRAREARAVFESRQGARPYALAAAIPASPPLDRYPAAVQDRLGAVAGAVGPRDGGIRWIHGRGARQPSVEAQGGVTGPMAVGLLLVLVFGPWLLGLVFVVKLVLS
jgi:hypothetical protein